MPTDTACPTFFVTGALCGTMIQAASAALHPACIPSGQCSSVGSDVLVIALLMAAVCILLTLASFAAGQPVAGRFLLAFDCSIFGVILGILGSSYMHSMLYDVVCVALLFATLDQICSNAPPG